MKHRKYKFQMDGYVSCHFYDPDGLGLDVIDQVVNIKEQPLVIKVDSRQVTSKGPFVSHVAP